MPHNPIDDYFKSLGGPLSPTPASVSNPIDAYFASGGLTPLTPLAPEVTAVERFGKGLGRELLYPVRSLLPNRHPPEDLGVAGMAGGLVGMTLSFVPYFHAARAVTTGIGILRNVPRLQRMAEGATSFAAFEALAGETPMEGVKEIPQNLLIGGAFELAALEVAKAWRGRFPRYVEEGNRQKAHRPPKATDPPQVEVAVDPYAYQVERWFAVEGETPEITLEKLKAVQDPAANLYQAVTRIVHTRMPGGSIVFPGVPDIKTAQGIEATAKELGFKVAHHLDDASGRFEVLVVDPERTLLRPKSKVLKAKLMQPGGDIRFTPEEALQLIQEHGEVNVKLYKPGNKNKGSIPGRPRDAGTFFPPGTGPKSVVKKDPNKPFIAIAGRFDSAEQFSTIVHEYTHFLHFRTLKSTKQPIAKLFNLSKSTHADQAQLLTEFHAATIELLTQENIKIGWSKKEAREQALKAFNEGVDEPGYGKDYYKQETELLARLSELMLLDPKKAREVAPRASRLWAGFIIQKSPQLRELMTKEVSAVDDMLHELWVRREGGLTVWQKGKPEVTEKDLRQFTKTGFYPGMQVFADGKEAEFVKRVGDMVEVRLSRTGQNVEFPIEKIQRPTIPEVLKQDRETLSAVDKMVQDQIIDGRPKWVAMNVRVFPEPATPQNAQGFIQRAVVDLSEFEFTTSLRRWLRTNLTDEQFNQMTKDVMERGFSRGQFLTQSESLLGRKGNLLSGQQPVILAALKDRGAKGLAIYDKGALELVVADKGTIMTAEEVGISFMRNFGGEETIAGVLERSYFFPDLDDTLRSILREKGVMEHDLPYFLNLTRSRYGQKLRELADSDTRQALENVESAMGSFDPLRIEFVHKKSMDSDSPLRGLITRNTRPGEGPIRLTHFTKKGWPGTHEHFNTVEEAMESAREYGYVESAMGSASPPQYPTEGLRLGKIKKGGAHFSEGGNMAGFGDEGNPNTRRFRYPNAKIANADNPDDWEAVIAQARADAPEWVAPEKLDEYLEELDNLEPGMWTYDEVEELHLDKAAKKLGFDGIRKWEQGDITHPTTVNIWNLKTIEEVDSQAARAGFTRTLTNDGKIELREASSSSVVGSFPDEDSALRYAARSGFDSGGPPIADHPSGSGFGGDGPPPRPQAQLPGDNPLRSYGKSARAVDALSLFGATFTALENFAKAAENRGLGAAFSKVFNPAQLAILEVDNQLAGVKREMLDGVTFVEKLKDLEKLLRGVPRNRQATVTEYVEALSKEEIAMPGGLLQRGMTENEIRVATELERMGLQNDLPRLMTMERLINNALKGETKLELTLQKLRRIQHSPETAELLKVFEEMPRFKSRDEVVDFLQLTADERWALKLIGESITTDKDKFSIFAVSRYAAAPRLRPGFKTGREQFAVDHRLTSSEKKAADVIDKLLETTFRMSGLDPKRQIGGYWPHMRMWAQYGWNPADVGRFAGLPKEFVDWSHDRFRTGELDIYNMDPLMTTFKYIRGLLMKQHFDPILPDIVQNIKHIQSKDPRVARIMSEYIEELKGRPHASFRKVQDALAGGLRALVGRDPPPALVEHTVNSLAALAAAAAIPFRPALIIRNWFESAQKIAPRVGTKYYLKALQYVTHPSTKAEAYELARNAKAITVGPQALRSIHASDDIFGPGASKLNYKLERMLEKGFRWYQSADDFGRAVAFHAQRMRMGDHYSDFVRGTIDLDTYLERAKVLTFDPVDVAEAERLLKAGNLQGAQDYLGRTLARETMNRYGHANHPAGWNSVAGRLFGQFGTWPVQYKDFLLQGLSRGTVKDRVEFAMTHSAIMGGTLAGGYAAGLNLMSWIGFPSLTYTGGPMSDMAIDIARSLNGSDTEKALARRNLIAQIPILGWMETGRPNSIFLPGSYLLGDLMQAAQADDAFEATLTAGGFRVLKADEKTALDWFMEL